MKWPVKKPDWWKPWYKYQVLTLLAGILNVAEALWNPSNVLVTLNWIAVGFMLAQFISNEIIFRGLENNRRLRAAIDDLMTMQTNEIGETIAQHLSAQMRGDQPPVVTRH